MFAEEPHTDLAPTHWLLHLFPKQYIPYLVLARLDRPTGWWLLLIPCWLSLLVANHTVPHASFPLRSMCLFFFGAIVMRAAGCTLNDMMDRDLDRQVVRTQNRPLASGQLSLTQACVFLALLLLVGLGILLLFNTTTILLGISSLVLVSLYPLTKRFFCFPQLVLGLTFSWGALLGWSQVKGVLTVEAALLYLGAFFWIVGYDLIYAIQDYQDDSAHAIHSGVVFLKGYLRPTIAVSYTLSALCYAICFYALHFPLSCWFGLLFYWILLMFQVVRLDLNDKRLALKLFKFNTFCGLILVGFVWL